MDSLEDFDKVWFLQDFISEFGTITNSKWRPRLKDGALYREVIFGNNDYLRAIVSHTLDKYTVDNLIYRGKLLKVGHFKNGKYIIFNTWKSSLNWQDVHLDFPEEDLLLEKKISDYIAVTEPVNYHATWRKQEQKILPYYYIQEIDSEYSYVYQYFNYGLGLSRNGKLVIPCDYNYITRPVDGWCFAIRRYPYVPGLPEWDRYYVILCDVIKKCYTWIEPKDIIDAAEDLYGDDIYSLLSMGAFRLYKIGTDRNDLHSYTVQDKFIKIYMPSFLKLIGEPLYVDKPITNTYWVSKEEAEKFVNKPAISVGDTDEKYGRFGWQDFTVLP